MPRLSTMNQRAFVGICLVCAGYLAGLQGFVHQLPYTMAAAEQIPKNDRLYRRESMYSARHASSPVAPVTPVIPVASAAAVPLTQSKKLARPATKERLLSAVDDAMAEDLPMDARPGNVTGHYIAALAFMERQGFDSKRVGWHLCQNLS